MSVTRSEIDLENLGKNDALKIYLLLTFAILLKNLKKNS